MGGNVCPDEETCVFMALSGRTESRQRLWVGGEVCFDGCMWWRSGRMFGEHCILKVMFESQQQQLLCGHKY